MGLSARQLIYEVRYQKFVKEKLFSAQRKVGLCAGGKKSIQLKF